MGRLQTVGLLVVHSKLKEDRTDNLATVRIRKAQECISWVEYTLIKCKKEFNPRTENNSETEGEQGK